ncbi:MAG: hypothetical protein Q8M76_14960, partial [Spirochaetaceae bacterium]|nr:hypothetical protein [Spirochaetaceae bacterium]
LILRRAIAFGNADVKDFSLDDPGRFLSNTWKLLPESNVSLRRKGVFSIKEYRVALQKMLGFFRSLHADAIFHDFDGTPTSAEMRVLREAAARNLAFAQTYMKAKLLAVGLLEAVAEVSGGDAPMALFMGDIPAEGESGEDILSSLPPAPAPKWIDTGNPLYRLLKDGRLDESSFDLKNSPLALYLYHRLLPGVWKSQVDAAENHFAGKIGAEGFLAGFGEDVIRDFALGCARMVPTRREALEAWAALHRRVTPL